MQKGKALRNVKPICLMPAKGIKFHQIQGMCRGIVRTLQYAGVRDVLSWVMPSEWRQVYGTEGVQYASPLDWCLEIGRVESIRDGYLNGDAMIRCMNQSPLSDWYSIVATDWPVYSVRDSGNIVEAAGLASAGKGCVLTVHNSTAKTDQDQADYCEFLVSHELGHAFGLLPNDRETDVTKHTDYGKHCARRCTMRLGSNMKLAIRDALKLELFCELCRADLPKHFI